MAVEASNLQDPREPDSKPIQVKLQPTRLSKIAILTAFRILSVASRWLCTAKAVISWADSERWKTFLQLRFYYDTPTSPKASSAEFILAFSSIYLKLPFMLSHNELTLPFIFPIRGWLKPPTFLRGPLSFVRRDLLVEI